VKALGLALSVVSLCMLAGVGFAEASSSSGLEAAKSATVAISDHSAGNFGSGVVVAPGFVLTAAHVTQGAEDAMYAFELTLADGGAAWTQIAFWPYSPDFRISDIKFSTPLDGWVVGLQQTSSASPTTRHDFAAHTTDGGLTWDFYADAVASDFGSTGTNVGIYALDVVGNRMWMVGGNGAILTTRPRAVASVTSASKTLTSYGQKAVVAGALTLGGAPLAGKRVDLWTAASANGPYVKTPLGGTTTAGGAFSITVAPTNLTWYKARFGGDSIDRDSALSAAAARIIPAPYVSNPIAPSKMKRSKYYTVYGYLKPKHSVGSYPVRIHLYRYVSGKWRSAGYVKARASNYSSYSKYSARVRLTKRGKWRLRAYHPADAGQTARWSSGYDYVRVP
jgi:hypothetical protein